MLKLHCRIKAKKLVSESAYLDLITVRLQLSHNKLVVADLDVKASLSNKS